MVKRHCTEKKKEESGSKTKSPFLQQKTLQKIVQKHTSYRVFFLSSLMNYHHIDAKMNIR